MNYYLVDYENVKSHGLDGIVKMPPEDVVSIFYSENADTMTFSLHQKLNETRAHVIYEKVEVGTKNALDFQLVTELGYLIREMQDQDVSFFIVSKDKGYGNTVTYWKKRGVRIAQVVDVSGLNEEKIENDLRMRVEPLVRDKEVVSKVVKMILQYKTKQGINNALMKEFPSNNNKRASEIYTAIKPLLSDKKGTVETPQIQAETPRAEMPQSRFEKQSEIFESILMKSDNLPAGPVRVPTKKEEPQKAREELPKKEEPQKNREELPKKEEPQRNESLIPEVPEIPNEKTAVLPEEAPKTEEPEKASEMPKQEEKPQKAKRTNSRGRKSAQKKAEPAEIHAEPAEAVAPAAEKPAEEKPAEEKPAEDKPAAKTENTGETQDQAVKTEAPAEKTADKTPEKAAAKKTSGKKTGRSRKTADKPELQEAPAVNQPEKAEAPAAEKLEKPEVPAAEKLEKPEAPAADQAEKAAAPAAEKPEQSEKTEKPKRNYRRRKPKAADKPADGSSPKEEA